MASCIGSRHLDFGNELVWEGRGCDEKAGSCWPTHVLCRVAFCFGRDVLALVAERRLPLLRFLANVRMQQRGFLFFIATDDCSNLSRIGTKENGRCACSCSKVDLQRSAAASPYISSLTFFFSFHALLPLFLFCLVNISVVVLRYLGLLISSIVPDHRPVLAWGRWRGGDAPVRELRAGIACHEGHPSRVVSYHAIRAALRLKKRCP